MHPPEITEHLLRLRSVPFLQELPSADLVQLARSLRPRTFQKGEVLLREDAPPRAFYMIASGAVTLRRRGKVIGVVRAPGGVGFLSILARNSGGTEAVADAQTEAYELAAEGIEEMFEDHFSVFLGTLRWVIDQLLVENRRQKPPPYVPPLVLFDHLIGDRELGLVERIFLVRRTRAFADANVNSIARLVRRMEEIRVDANTTLWREGEPSAHSFFVVKGMLRLSWNDDAGEEQIQSIGPGYIVGGAESLMGYPRWNELSTLEPAVLLRGSREALIDLLEDDHEMALKFLEMIASFLMALWDERAEAGILSVGVGDGTSGSPSAEHRAKPPADGDGTGGAHGGLAHGPTRP